MNSVKVELKGLEDILKQLDTVEMEKDITYTLQAFGEQVAADAKNNLSLNGTVDMGFLSNSIGSQSLQPLTVEIFAHKDYAAYVEFGTGPYAAVYVPSLEQEWQELARKFFVNGKGTMPAQPYLHPAFEKNWPILLDDLRDLIKKPNK